MTSALADVRAHEVRAVARRSGSSFYYAFLTLPRAEREAIQAVYAFCHAVDDAVDETPDPAEAARLVEAWRGELARAFAGQAKEPIAVQVGAIARTFDLPRRFFDEIIDGVAQDLVPGRRLATWSELEHYCDLVAGAVGRLCVRIFGRRDETADRYAHDLGLALQLTNILRDLGEDARMGRFYLPTEDLARFGVTEADVLEESPRREALLAFEADRARGYFARAAETGRGDARRLCAAEVMGAIYRSQLEAVIDAGYPVRRPSARLPRWRKVAIAAGAWARCRMVRR